MKTLIFYKNMMKLDNLNKLNIPYTCSDGNFLHNDMINIPIKIVDFHIDELSFILKKLNTLQNIGFNRDKYIVEEISVKDAYNNIRVGYIIT